MYDRSRVEPQRQASEAGKTISFSAGNGRDSGQNVVPNTRLQSSLQGPDWNVVVSGIDPVNPRDNVKSGHRKFVDISGVGASPNYRTAFGAERVADSSIGEGAFAATSNAVAMTSGTYAYGL